VVWLGIGFSLHWALLFLLSSIVGWQLLIVGLLARAIYGVKDRWWKWCRRLFAFNTSVLISLGLLAAGIFSFLPLVREYLQLGLRLRPELSAASYQAVGGLGLTLLGFIHFTFSLVYGAVSHSRAPEAPRGAVAPAMAAVSARR
jgi:hypothetical protein